ncbi:MAG: hypothetical protein IT367_12780 [Candidatus Hydrogenedentes bacterium]|nr:hypothetical protein [Candidatus Hydrogenedentota bacterium]
MKRRIAEARGMTLPETLVYVALSVVVLNLCTVTFIQSSRFSTAATQRALHQQSLAQFSSDLTRAVHSASRVLERAGDTVTNDRQVVLDTPDGVVVIGTAGESIAIWGLAQEGDAWRLTRVKRYAARARAMQIEFDTSNAGEARRLTFRITGPPRKEPDDTANNRAIVAALRVDGALP